MSDRPNVLVFVPDQLRADAIGAFGNPHVHTPNIDRLAARGTRFDNAYVQHPVCSPSRVSFLTGWYPHVRGHRSLRHLLRPDEPNFLRTFRASGYHVAWAGARGDTFAPGATEASVDEYGFTVLPTVSPGDGHAYPDDVAARTFYVGRQANPDIVDFDEAAIRTAVNWLEGEPTGPWLLFVPIMAPHCPFQVSDPWYSLHDRATVPDPAPPADDPTREPGFMSEIRRRHGLDRVSAEQWREIIATYYGMISRMDAHLGRVLAAIDGIGATDRTLVAFFADHGEFLGDYGLIEKWPSALSGNIVCDPLILAGPGVPGGESREDMVELIDVFPTLLALCGVPDDTHRHYGRSLAPLLGDPKAGHREYAFSEGGFTEAEEPQLEPAFFPYDHKANLQHEQPKLVGKAVAVRTHRWTYVERLYEGPELYDRLTDPHERVNLAGRTEFADVQLRLREAIHRWLLETTDVMPYDEHPRFPVVDLVAPGGDDRSRVATAAFTSRMGGGPTKSKR